MPKTLTVQSLPRVNPIEFVFTEGTMTGLRAGVEVNYGETAIPVVADVWSDMTKTEKDKARALYDRIRQLVEAEFLGD